MNYMESREIKLKARIDNENIKRYTTKLRDICVLTYVCL